MSVSVSISRIQGIVRRTIAQAGLVSLVAATSGCVGADQPTGGTNQPSAASTTPASAFRTGIWLMHPVPDAAELKHLEAAMSRNPYLAGVCFQCGWNEIEKESGHYDFGDIDRAIAAAKSAGKKYQLKIKPGVSTPEFVYKEGAASFKTVASNPNRDNYGGSLTIPIPWDPIYQEHFSKLIKALGAKYSNDPACVCVV